MAHRIQGLPSQQVKVLRRRRAVRDPQVVLRASLQEPFETGAGVLGPLSLEAMGKEQRQS